MNTFFVVCLVLLLASVLAVLAMGVLGMARGGGSGERSNKLMRWRVILQAAALVLFALVMLAR
ncbi:MAG: twin transmembrane helix small protein [Alphaproteobacteria bacterium]|nr:twin transmembrane helix small protein [Alphaproteobacteria bacterium]